MNKKETFKRLSQGLMEFQKKRQPIIALPPKMKDPGTRYIRSREIPRGTLRVPFSKTKDFHTEKKDAAGIRIDIHKGKGESHDAQMRVIPKKHQKKYLRHS